MDKLLAANSYSFHLVTLNFPATSKKNIFKILDFWNFSNMDLRAALERRHAVAKVSTAKPWL